MKKNGGKRPNSKGRSGNLPSKMVNKAKLIKARNLIGLSEIKGRNKKHKKPDEGQAQEDQEDPEDQKTKRTKRLLTKARKTVLETVPSLK